MQSSAYGKPDNSRRRTGGSITRNSRGCAHAPAIGPLLRLFHDLIECQGHGDSVHWLDCVSTPRSPEWHRPSGYPACYCPNSGRAPFSSHPTRLEPLSGDATVQVHLVFYRWTKRELTVERLMHGRRDLPRRLLGCARPDMPTEHSEGLAAFLSASSAVGSLVATFGSPCSCGSPRFAHFAATSRLVFRALE
jgi:hypothetical protein